MTPSLRATQGRRGALHQGVDDDHHDDDVEQEQSECSARPVISGIIASTIGTAPRSPDQDRNACSRQGSRNGSAAATTEIGRATSSTISPITMPGSSAAGQPARVDVQARA